MILGILGKIGQGKTFTAVVLAYSLKQKEGYKIYSNIKSLKINDYYISSPSELYNLPEDEGKKLLLLDELQAWFNSRKSMSRHNVKATTELMQSRKLNYDIIYTQQYLKMVDITLRWTTDYYVFPNMSIEDKYVRLNLEFLSPYDMSIVKFKKYKVSKNLLDLYDTKEKIQTAY